MTHHKVLWNWRRRKNIKFNLGPRSKYDVLEGITGPNVDKICKICFIKEKK